MAASISDPANAAALSTLLDNAINDLPATNSTASFQDGFLFSGNRHESVPRALLLDKRLTPLERNTWQVFRLLLNKDGLTAFPTYDQLAPYLASMPCTPKASHETVARALTILRLARWLSLARRQRDAKTGRIRGNLYILHDDPLTPFEAIQLDPGYLELVSDALGHTSKAIQRVGSQVLDDFSNDPLMQGRALPSRLQILGQRLHHSVSNAHESEDGEPTPLRNREWLTSESEPGVNASKSNVLRNPKSDSTKVRIKHSNYSVRTIPRELSHLRFPDRFSTLKPEQQSGSLFALQQVNRDLQQAVLDEWTVRCCDGNVRNPAGYLFGIIQKAIRGEFNACASPTDDFTSKTTSTELPYSFSTIQNLSEEHLQKLHSFFDKPSS